MVDKIEYVKQIQVLHKGKTGKDIPDDLALEYFEKLVVLTSVVYKPIPKTSFEKYAKR